MPEFWSSLSAGPHSFFFDFDGTLYPGESLEEVLAMALAEDPARDQKVEALSALGRRGMEGTLPFEESLRGRLDVVRPHRRHIEQWVERAVERVDPMMRSLVSDLAAGGHTVRVMSGGFRSCIEPVVRTMGVEGPDVRCNEFRFREDGWAIGLDEHAPLSRSGGKPETVRELVRQGLAPGRRLMVGDGATDLEAVAEGACDAMLGYGVHAVRSTVRDNADIFFDRIVDFDRFVRSHFL